MERRAVSDRSGPKPWFGCDTNGEAWRAYCEAWTWFAKRRDPRLRGMIYDIRGKAAVDALEANIEVVRRDYNGEIDDRAAIPRLLKL